MERASASTEGGRSAGTAERIRLGPPTAPKLVGVGPSQPSSPKLGAGPRSAWESAPVDLGVMLSRPAVALFALVAIEYVAITQLAGVIGGMQTALLMLVLSAVGVMAFRRVGASFLETSVATAMQSAGLQNVPGAERFAGADASADKAADRAMMLFGALLMIVPGLVSGVLGALFFLPPVRALARPVVLHRIQPWIRPNLRFARGTMGFGRDVVDVDVVDDSSNEPPSPRAELR